MPNPPKALFCVGVQGKVSQICDGLKKVIDRRSAQMVGLFKMCSQTT